MKTIGTVDWEVLQVDTFAVSDKMPASTLSDEVARAPPGDRRKSIGVETIVFVRHGSRGGVRRYH